MSAFLRKNRKTFFRHSGALALLTLAIPNIYANIEESAVWNMFSDTETLQLISDASSPESGMCGIAYETGNIPQIAAGNASVKVSDTKNISTATELEIFRKPRKRNFKPVPVTPLTDWHRFLFGQTRPRRIIYFPPQKKNTDEREKSAGTHNSATDIRASVSEAGTLTNTDNVNLRELSFLSVSAGSAEVSYNVTPIAEDTESGNGTAGAGGLVDSDGKYIESDGHISVAFQSGNNNRGKNLWQEDATTGQGSLSDHKLLLGAYKDSSQAVVVFKQHEAEDGTMPVYVYIGGIVTPKEIIIASGNYQFIPKQNSGQGTPQDGWIGDPSESGIDGNLQVCQGATLTLTDDNHYTGDTHIYGTVILDGEPLAKKDNAFYETDSFGNTIIQTGKLGDGNVFVYNTGALTIGTAHLNNESLNIQGGKVVLGVPEDEGDELVPHTLLQTAKDNHAEDGAVIRLGENGTGGTLDISGGWANGHYELYSGKLTSLDKNEENAKTGYISGKIEIDIAAGETLEIENIVFSRDLSSIEQHTHTAAIENGGQLLLTGSTDIRLHTLDVTLEKPKDGEISVVPVVFEAYETGETKANLDVSALNITLDQETLDDLIRDSTDGDGKSKYQIISVSNAPDGSKLSDYVTTNFTTVTINGGSVWNATINEEGHLILFSEIPEPAAFTIMAGLVAATLSGTRRRKRG